MEEAHSRWSRSYVPMASIFKQPVNTSVSKSKLGSQVHAMEKESIYSRTTVEYQRFA
jgi:hypothetical protein